MIEIYIFLVAFLSSFIGLIIPGIASALSVSSLILFGIPVQIAKTTYQIGNLGINLGALIPLFRSQKVRKDLMIPLLLISFISWFLWGEILVNIPPSLLLKLTGFFMIVLLSVNIFSRSLGTVSAQPSKRRKYAGFFGYFVLNILFSIFPMGMGVLYQFLHTFFFRVTNLESRLMGCFLTIPFIVGFIFSIFHTGIYNMSYAVFFGLWWYFGGYVGAKSSIKLGNTWLKKILMTWLFFLGIYFLFFAK